LREGLFLLDEPELHLNSDLIRTWVVYLTSTVQTGQIWLATHSLEAVETAGQQATFVLERNEETRKVDNVARLDTRPILSALSRAVGTPAFSISQLIFVFIEGEEGVGERERFYKLTGLQQNIRFMECGSCNEVLHRVDTITTLAKETEVGIRVGGIIDRDFRSDNDASELIAEHNVFVLSVHEIENFFFHPVTLQLLLKQNGKDAGASLEFIREFSDKRAGSWIFQHAMSTRNAKSLPGISESAKRQAKALSWQDFKENSDTTISRIIVLSDYEDAQQQKLKNILDISVKAYKRKRSEDDLWKHCEGKQVLNDVALAAGFIGASAMIQAVFVAWERDNTVIPQELIALRDYLAKL
jgi:hypothetical protein